MKREILFKAKRVDNGEWVFGYLIKKQLHNKFDSPPSLMYEKWFIDKGSDINLFDGIFQQVEVHPETVCQFTGLLDKNGNKIFEGDKINFSCAINGSFIDSVVEYDSIDGAWSINWDKERNRVHYFFNEIEECEIIGNIHD